MSARVCPPLPTGDCPLHSVRGSREERALRRLERAVAQEAGTGEPSLRDAVRLDAARGVTRLALPSPVRIEFVSRKETTHVPVARSDQ